MKIKLESIRNGTLTCKNSLLIYIIELLRYLIEYIIHYYLNDLFKLSEKRERQEFKFLVIIVTSSRIFLLKSYILLFVNK
jgi:hypothetical protein